MINVTQTFFPPIEEYQEQLKRIWNNKWLTNRGQLVLELEEKLKKYLNVKHILLTNNGTLPIQIVLKLLGCKGEVITTPFSYIATSAAIVWENCTPVFVDIHPEYLTIDETKIEDAITDKTTCILATHVFGNPCNIEAIECIALKYGLKVIYDAAHAFDVIYKGKSIFEYGDVSTCSFHATKLFHTAEGGALFTSDIKLQHQIYYSHNFGHDGPISFHGLGINGKISELQAAMGLTVLPHVESIISQRERVIFAYNSFLIFKNITTLKIRDNTKWNYSYYPVIFKNESTLLKVQNDLNIKNIFPRRYFYPSLNNIDYLKGQKMPISESVASRVLCLPLYGDLSNDEIFKICLIINNIINNE